MKKLFLVLIVIGSFLNAQNLKFRPNGEFKILQFTDIHWSEDHKFTDKTTETLRKVISKEKPDFIVLSGDNVNCIPMKNGWQNLGKIIEEAKIPWTLVFGNHDEEQDWSKLQSFEFLKAFPHFMGEKGSVHGVINYSVPVFSHDGRQASAYLYFLDSGDYTRNPKLGSYDWIRRDQVQWFAQESEKHAKNDGKILPSLMFFHIPLQEYAEVLKDSATVGDKKEEVSSSEINSGLFAALIEQKNVMATFCGHDHDNNFIGVHKGIALAYGNKTGNDGYGELEQGGRVIVLKENKFAFDTYLSRKTENKYFYSFPAGLSNINEKTKVLKSQNVSPKPNGLAYRYFEGNMEATNQIEKGKLVKQGTANEINLKNAAAEDHFGLIFKGFIKIPETAFYKFYTYSDDGSVLKIDGQAIVDNDGGHSAARMEGIVALEKGFHSIEILYFEDYMGQVLDVGISSVNMAEQPLNAEMLYH